MERKKYIGIGRYVGTEKARHGKGKGNKGIYIARNTKKERESMKERSTLVLVFT